MNTDFQQSLGKEHSQSPGKERGATPECQRIGITRGYAVMKYGAFTDTNAYRLVVGGFSQLPQYPFPSGQPTWPKADYYKLRITFVVVAPPTSPFPDLGFVLASWKYPPDHVSVALFDAPAEPIMPVTSVCYYDDGLEFLTEEATVPTVIFPPGYPGGYVLYARPRAGQSFYVPSTPGTYVFNYKIRARPFCHIFFKAFANPGGAQTASTFPSDHTVTLELFRVFRMLVRYITNTLTARVGDNIQFTDVTVTDNAKTAWLWNFGDGGTSAVANPLRSYATAGSYAVNLSITDSSEETYAAVAPNILTVSIRPRAAFTFTTALLTVATRTIAFTNTSQGGATYLWNFGDGTTSTSASPANHLYNRSLGNVTVTLTVTAAGATDVFSTNISVA